MEVRQIDDDPDVKLWHGDCLELMGRIPDGSVDMIAADLPYGTTACRWDVVIPFESLWLHYRRIIKPRGAIVLTASQPFTSALVMSNPEWFRYEWIWDKALPSGSLDANRRPLRRHESVAIFGDKLPFYRPQMTKGPMRKKGGGGTAKTAVYGDAKPVSTINDDYYPTSILRVSNANMSGRVHPCQKPTDLFEYLIRTYTDEGETVLDNTMGSGTTGVACLRTGRRFIGIEQDAGYFEIAQRRIAEEKAKIESVRDSA